MEQPALHPLSCKRCKQRKVKCSRVIPRCHKCQEHDFECSYPERRSGKRASALVASSSRAPRLAPPSIFALHERLKRLEQQCAALPEQQQADTQGGPPVSECVASDLETQSGTEETTPSTFFNDNGGSASFNAAHPATRLDEGVSLALRGSSTEESIEALRASIDKVQQLMAQSFLNEKSVTQEAHIPKDMARSWLEKCLALAPEAIFPSLVHFDLLRLMPDILELPHVHVDGVMVMIYYCALHFGATIPEGDAPLHREWGRKLYLCALRAMQSWQREASGTGTDMVAAILMARMACENFDLTLAFNLQRLACEYAQAWKLHRVDAADGPVYNVLGRPISDEDRRAFWELVQLDLIFRLLHNQPPSITSKIDSWKINLPWLITGLEQDEGTVLAIQFLVRIRLAFIVSDFFHLIDPSNESQSGSEILDKTDRMCEQIEGLFSEWNMDDWFQNIDQDIKESWMTAEVVLLGHMSMVCMIRHATARVRQATELEDVDAEVARKPTVQRVCSRMLTTASYFIQKHPEMCNLSTFFSFLRIDLPYTYLARNILQAPRHSPLKEDKLLLDNISQVLGVMAMEIVELKPLAWAAYRLSLEVELKACLTPASEMSGEAAIADD